MTDRVVYQMLDALLWLRRGRSAAERLSYQSLNVEQIGHVYEGLLEFSCRRVDLPHVGLIGKREPELPLGEVEAAAREGEEKLRGWLADRCDLTARQVEKARQASPSPEQLAALHAACDNDAGLAQRVRPFWAAAHRPAPPADGVPARVGAVHQGRRPPRHRHPLHPRELAEEVVTHTLDPLCFDPGPAQGVTDPQAWRPRTAGELLALKVLDPAMGSGAFLVTACRYLADVLVRAWERDGVPAEAAELAGTDGDRDDLLLAARRMVAARCLYGVDRDDMAVELAKLSLWLVTLAKGKPFGFLDHAFRCGDSLVGVVSTDQLAAFHLDPERGKLLNDRLSGAIDQRIDAVLAEMTELRQAIESSVVEDARQSADKAGKLQQADRAAGKLRLTADAVVAAALSTAGRPDSEYDDRLTSVADEVYAVLGDTAPPAVEQELRDVAARLARRPPGRASPPAALAAGVRRGDGTRRLRRGRRQPTLHRRQARQRRRGSLEHARDALDLDHLKEAHYRDTQSDGCQARGTTDQLVAALQDDDFARAVRALADFLLTSRTAYARFHNPPLPAAVVAGAGRDGASLRDRDGRA